MKICVMEKIELLTDKQEIKIDIAGFEHDNIEVYWESGFEHKPEKILLENPSPPLEHKYEEHKEHHIIIIGNVRSITLNYAFKSLDFSNNQKIEEIYCRSNHLASLNIENCTSLKVLKCNSNGLKTLDVSTSPHLEILDCSLNRLEDLDIANNTLLKELICDKNFLSHLDISNHKNLEHLNCSENRLSLLNIDKCTVLNYLSCYGNSFTTEEMNKIYEGLPNVGYDENMELRGMLNCGKLGNWKVAVQKGWKIK